MVRTSFTLQKAFGYTYPNYEVVGPKQRVYLEESVVDMIANPKAGDRKVRTR